MIDTVTLWVVIVGLGIGSYFLRFSFLGLVGDRPLPNWLLRHLRYTAVAILPALVAPLVAYSDAAGTGPEFVRLIAALATLGVGIWRRDVLWAMCVGALILGLGMALS